jgi:hexosaminidase
MKFKFSLSLLIIILALTSCELKKESRMTIIPKPQKVVVNSGEFKINRNTKIIIDEEDLQINKAVKYLHNRINTACGYDLPIKNSVDNLSSNYIHFKLTDNSNIIKEGYLLNVENDRIVMEASTPAGFFYAVQTIFQLLPPEIYGYEESSGAGWQIPAVSISDKPRFPWRGMHLDVGRHYFDKEFIKKYIDLLAMHKMNKFHWHLTEDQGWRIEIKKYPRLTEISSVRQETMGDGKPYGGYYTQKDIKEIVKYAEDRFITIIPEIEMPGHSVAVLAAYPEFACTDGPFEVATEWGIHKDVYCAGNEKTFQFLEDVLTEVIDLFPSKYIHIGGDECPKDRWKECTKCQARIKNKGLKDEHELQSYFIKRIEKLLSLKGKNLIGWDEILEGGLAPQATVMSWRGIKGGVAAAQQNHDVIMSPTSHCYFDYFQGSPLNEPTAFGGYLPISKVYSYEPIFQLVLSLIRKIKT